MLSALLPGPMGWPWSGGVGFGGASPIDGRPLDDVGGLAARLRKGLAAVAQDVAAGAPFSSATHDLCDRSPFPLSRRAVIWMVNRRARSKYRDAELRAHPGVQTYRDRS